MTTESKVVPPSQSGSATVEQTGLILMLALFFVALIGLLLLGGHNPVGRGLGERLANRIGCGPRQPDACSHHPAVTAYGWPVARLARYLVPGPVAKPGPGGMVLVPVDFRYCQRSSCAVPGGADPDTGEVRTTTANRRITVFTEVRHPGGNAPGGGELEIVYWLYRPGLGWEDIHRYATRADVEAASGTRVLLKDSPMLVPLETLDGRNHIRFPKGETPPWQWQVSSTFENPGSPDD